MTSAVNGSAEWGRSARARAAQVFGAVAVAYGFRPALDFTAAAPDPPARSPMCVGGVVLRGDKILLVRRKYGGGWCIPCGNSEVGEDVRHAVVRELKEETGLDVAVESLVDALSTHHPATADKPARSVVGVYFKMKELGGVLQAGDDAAEALFYPLGDLPAEMAFAADERIIEQLKESGKG